MSSSDFRSFSGLIAENHAFVPIVQFAVVGQLWGFALGLFAEGERLKIRPDHSGDAATLGLGGDFPGLRHLFLPFHVAEPGNGALAPALFARLSRSLIDPDYVDTDAWVSKGRATFLAAANEWHDPTISRRIGSLLGNDLGQMRVQFNAKAYIVEPAYRDDNLGLWVPSEAPPPAADSETILETARAEKSETEPQRGQDGEPANATLPAAPSEAAGIPIATYPEWDFLIRQPRPNWTTLRAYAPKPGRKADIDCIIAAHAPLGQKLTTAIRAARVSRPRRLRAQVEGDTLDLDACISAAISLRAGERPDP